MVAADQARPTRATNHAAQYDLLILNGEVVDPSQGLRGPRDVAFASGKVAAVAPAGTIALASARQVIDANGKLVTAGLIDLHTHVYVGGSELVIPADEVCSVSGCTTVVDAGTAGANTMLGLHMLADAHLRTRVFAFVHISCFGLAGHPFGESRDLAYLDPELAARCVLSHRGFVLGVKVRQTQGLVGENGLEPLRRAIRAAELAQETIRRFPGEDAAANVPVMVHIGGAPAPIEELLSLLRPGDVVTHCFNGGTNSMLSAAGEFEEVCRVAQARGVHFDVGHGRGSFSHRVASAATAAGFWPNSISTDLHSASVNSPVVDMPTTMSKFLNYGMPLREVIEKSTVGPARFINRALPVASQEPLLGTLQPGAPGDAAVLDHQHGGFDFMDSLNVQWKGAQRLVPVHTVRAGRLWGRPYPHPYLVP